MRKPFLAGNWKMNTSGAGSLDLASSIVKTLNDITTVDIAVCPPFVYLQSIAKALSSSNISLGAQNAYFEDNGAFTLKGWSPGRDLDPRPTALQGCYQAVAITRLCSPAPIVSTGAWITGASRVFHTIVIINFCFALLII